MSDKPLSFKILRFVFGILNFVSNIGVLILIINLLTITERRNQLQDPFSSGAVHWKNLELNKLQILIALIATNIALTGIQGIVGWLAICSLKPTHFYIYTVLIIINLVFFISTVAFDRCWEGSVMGIVYDSLLVLMMFHFVQEVKNLYY